MEATRRERRSAMSGKADGSEVHAVAVNEGERLGRIHPLRPERTRARPEDREMIASARGALALLDSKWSVDLVFLMASGIRRHARLFDNVPGISKKMLTASLRALEREGLVERRVYADAPVRVEYSLTPLGWKLTELLMGLYEWASEHAEELAAAGKEQRERGAAVLALPARGAPSSVAA
jgi:DNA-binding HxlR family transcriptional regulator